MPVTDDDAFTRRLQEFHELVVDVALNQEFGCARSSPARVVEHAIRRGAAAFSRSQSSNTMLALLPPSSRVTRFTWAAGLPSP